MRNRATVSHSISPYCRSETPGELGVAKGSHSLFGHARRHQDRSKRDQRCAMIISKHRCYPTDWLLPTRPYAGLASNICRRCGVAWTSRYLIRSRQEVDMDRWRGVSKRVGRSCPSLTRWYMLKYANFLGISNIFEMHPSNTPDKPSAHVSLP